MGSIIMCALGQLSLEWSNQGGLDNTYSTHRTDVKWIQNFSGKTWKEEITRET
jgi:hypothetical protein